MADESTLLPAYLATGDDALKRERVAERLLKRVSTLGDPSFNTEQFDGETATGTAIVNACNTMPFMSEVRLVSVKNADKLKKADAEALVSYLESPAETTVLALYASSLAKNTRLYKAVAAFGKQAVIDCASVKKRELPSLVAQMARAHGLTMRDDAARSLIERVGEDTVRIDAELRKIALAHNSGDPVRPDEVERLVSRSTEAKSWEFVDAFSSRNAKACVRLRSHMPSASPYGLLAACVSRIRELIMTKALAERGQLGELPGMLKAPEWKTRSYPGFARNFTAEELRDALRTARDAEKLMKSSSNADQIFESWYLSVLGKRPKTREATLS